MNGVPTDKSRGGQDCLIGLWIIASILWNPSLVCIPRTLNLTGMWKKLIKKMRGCQRNSENYCTGTFKNICGEIVLIEITMLLIILLGISIYSTNFELFSAVSVWGGGGGEIVHLVSLGGGGILPLIPVKILTFEGSLKFVCLWWNWIYRSLCRPQFDNEFPLVSNWTSICLSKLHGTETELRSGRLFNCVLIRILLVWKIPFWQLKNSRVAKFCLLVAKQWKQAIS